MVIQAFQNILGKLVDKGEGQNSNTMMISAPRGVGGCQSFYLANFALTFFYFWTIWHHHHASMIPHFSEDNLPLMQVKNLTRGAGETVSLKDLNKRFWKDIFPKIDSPSVREYVLVS